MCDFYNKKGSIKTLCLSQGFHPGAVYALSCKVMENYKELLEFAQKFYEFEAKVEYFLIIVMIYEYSVNGLPDKRRKLGQNTRRIIQIIKNNQELVEQVQKLSFYQKQQIKNAIENSKTYEFSEIQCNKQFRVNINCMQQFADKCKQLNIQPQQTFVPYCFRIPNLPFNTLMDLGEYQSMSSCMPVYALEQLGVSGKLIDLCAAPGSKSLQSGQTFKYVFANEKDQKRFKVLQQRCQKHKNIQCSNQDAFKLLHNLNEKFDVMVLDPTCSGSGNNQIDQKFGKLMGQNGQESEDTGKSRITQLAEFQKNILQLAMSTGIFCQTKYISYSTCSVNREENEDVVSHCLQNCNAQWKLIKILPEWEFRGEVYDEVIQCGKAQQDGFFVAVFERAK